MRRPPHRIRVYVPSGLLFIVLTCTGVWAQSTAQISGTVKDQSGAVLPGVEVTATQTDTGFKRSVPTNETGAYVLANLPLGPYRLEAVLPGFRSYVQTGIILQVDANPTINPLLEIGQVSEQVDVSADATLVETRSSGVGTVVDNQRVLELPLNGRQVQELVVLAGQANINYNSGSLNSVRNYPTMVISVAGGIANGVTYQLDGVNNNDTENNLSLPMPFPDALQEFKVETSALAAQYGLHSSAVVNSVTKSGTNSFHGDAFEFVRNGIFNARDFFAPTRDTLKRNQYGGVIGGPIVKNKLFFFGGVQLTPQRSTPTQNIAYVPTPAMLAGDFTTIASPACNNGKQINLAASQGFVNNRISSSLFSAPALKIMNMLPVSSDPCGKVFYGLLNNQDEGLYVSRIDYNKSDKQSIFGRLFLAHLTVPTTYDGKDLLTFNNSAGPSNVYELALGHTYVVGSGAVVTSRISATRTVITKTLDVTGSWSDFGVNAIGAAGEKFITVSVAGIGNGFIIGTGNNNVTVANTGPTYNFTEDISVTRGAHQFGFGGSYMHLENSFHAGTNSKGTMSFNGQATGLGLADFLMGDASTWAQGNLSTYYMRQHYLGIYAQDAWKLAPRLTMSYGIRWEPYLSFTSKYGWFDHFDPLLFNQNVHSKVYTNSPAGMIYPGDSQYPCGQSIHCNRYNEFLPRMALAWDPKGDGRTSIRAAYGIFLDRAQTISLTGFGQDTPYGDKITLTNVSLANPWANYPGGNPFPITLSPNTAFPQFGTFVTHPLHAKPTAVGQWNLSIQRQVGTDWLFTLNYVGTETSHVPTGVELNPAVFLGLGPCTINKVNYSTCSTTANTNQRRLLYLQNPEQGQYYGPVYGMDDGGTGSYHGMFLSAQKRLSRGTTILANYTFSHCISDYWNAFVGGSGQDNGWNPSGRRLERGNCAADQRQVFNLSVVAQTPKFSGRALNLVASNWQVAPILKIKSGQFFTVTTGLDNALNGTTFQRANQVLANPYLPNKGVNGWLNPAAFANPAPGTYGNLAGKNSLLGPGAIILDLALSRTFPVGEAKSIQLRAETFNLPNHLNPDNPIATLNTAGTFGKIQDDNISGVSQLTLGSPRIMQFAIKYVF